jgi:hypothetical protein
MPMKIARTATHLPYDVQGRFNGACDAAGPDHLHLALKPA